MINAKGAYKWKLIDRETGKIKDSGEQTNLITDAGYLAMVGLVKDVNTPSIFGQPFRIFHSNSADDVRIFISETTPLPGTDFLRLTEDDGMGGIVSTEEGLPTFETNDGNHWKGAVLFSPPVSSRTLTIFGVSYNSENSLFSFIELTSPITQTDSDQLFVEYRMEISLVGSGSNVTLNNFISTYYGGNIIGEGTDHDDTPPIQQNEALQTQFLPPVDDVKVGRSPGSYDKQAISISPGTYSIDISKFKLTYSREFTETDIDPGPMGVMAFTTRGDITSIPCTLGHSPVPLDPNVSEVFKKAPVDYTLFNNPNPPFPVGKGAVLLTGTPTETVLSKEIRAYITRSGDASDIIPETFTTNFAVDNQLTVSQDWDNAALGGQVRCRLSTTGTLPSPLNDTAEYWVIYIDSTHLELSATEGGPTITLTSDGSGTHTITRTTTAQYTIRQAPSSVIDLTHTIPLEIDAAVASAPNQYSSSSFWDKSRWAVYVENSGNWLYKAQDVSGTWRLYKWQFGTIESGTHVSNFSAIPRNAIAIGTEIFMVDDTGLSVFDTTTDTVTDLFTGVTTEALLETECYDIAHDEVNNVLWIGHSLGLTEFDPVTKTVSSTHDIAGTFSGLTAARISVKEAQLSANSGFVCKGGGDQRNSPNINGSWVWVYDHLGTGKVASIDPEGNDQLSNPTFPDGKVHSVGLKGDGTGDLIAECGSKDLDVSDTIVYNEISLDFVPATPEHTVVQSVASPASPNNSFDATSCSRMFRLGADLFMSASLSTQGGKWLVSIFKPSIGEVVGSTQSTLNSGSWSFTGEFQDRDFFTLPLIRGVYHLNLGREIVRVGVYTEYGYNGASWDIDSPDPRDMPDAVHPILDGMSLNFENAGGQPSSEQFIQGESFAFTMSPLQVKTNLQKIQRNGDLYMCDATEVSLTGETIPGGLVYTVAEAPTGSSPVADWRFLEDASYLIKVEHAIDGVFTQVAGPPSALEYQVDSVLGTITFNAADAGKTIDIDYLYGERH